MNKFSQYWPLILLSIWMLYRFYKSARIRSNLKIWLEQGPIIIDVRSTAEFNAFHHSRSINVPLTELASTAATLPKDKMLLLCCASGTRSGIATLELKRRGFKNVHNIGPWTVLNNIK